MAAGMLRNRRVWSRPFLLIKRTRSPSLYARMRQPSTFSSYTQPSRWNGARTSVGPSACIELARAVMLPVRRAALRSCTLSGLSLITCRGSPYFVPEDLSRKDRCQSDGNSNEDGSRHIHAR